MLPDQTKVQYKYLELYSALECVVINVTDESSLVINFFKWVSQNYVISNFETAIWRTSFLDYFLPGFGFPP